MGREVRRVPKNWQHPKQKDGSYYPLFDGNFKEAFAEWMEGWEKWQLGLCEQYGKGDKWGPADPADRQMTYTERECRIPSPDDYMPEWTDEQKTHVMMYETCSEGTPISPAFETPEEMARWLADNDVSAFSSLTATYEEWLGMAKAGCAPSAVLDSTGVHSGVEYIGSVK